MAKEFELWTFKYEPTSLQNLIVNPDIRSKLEKSIIDIPSMFLYGPPGIGKGTFSHIFLKQTNLPNMWVNASDRTGIDFIRDHVRPFAQAAAIVVPKIVVMNEADALSSSAQKMLRQLMEDVQKICRFIFLANYEQYFIPELKSRCQILPFVKPPIKEMVVFASKILKAEDVKFDSKTLITLVQKCYPDIRKMIMSLQENSLDGELANTMTYQSEDVYNDIQDAMLEKNINKVETLLHENHILYEQLYEYLYDNSQRFTSQGGAILKIAEGLRDNRNALNQEINFMHMFMTMIWEKVIE